MLDKILLNPKNMQVYSDILSGKKPVEPETKGASIDISDKAEISTTPQFDSSGEFMIIPRTSRFKTNSRAVIKSAKDMINHSGGKIKKSLINNAGFLAKLDQNTKNMLEAEGYAVYPNVFVKLIPDYPIFGASADLQDLGTELKSLNTVLNNTEEPTLENKTNYTGKGKTIAIIDSGCYPHPDIKDHIRLFQDRSKSKPVTYLDKEAQEKTYDDHGHGTNVSGISASPGTLSGGKYKGTAPDADLAIYKLMDGSGGASSFDVVDRLLKIFKDIESRKDDLNITAVNMSFGMPTMNPDSNPIVAGANELKAKGVVPVAAAGNSGLQDTPNGMGAGTIDNIVPSVAKSVFTVGASFDNNTPELKDDEMALFSSHASPGVGKPDVVYKGERVMSLNAPDSTYEKMIKERLNNPQATALAEKVKNADPETLKALAKKIAANTGGQISAEFAELPTEKIRRTLLNYFAPIPTDGFLDDKKEHFAYSAMDGTSQASPGVVGIVADVREANPDLTPDQVINVIKETAYKLDGVPDHIQGAGEVDRNAAVKKAEKLQKGLSFDV